MPSPYQSVNNFEPVTLFYVTLSLCGASRSVLDCGSPLPLFVPAGVVMTNDPTNPRMTRHSKAPEDWRTPRPGGLPCAPVRREVSLFQLHPITSTSFGPRANTKSTSRPCLSRQEHTRVSGKCACRCSRTTCSHSNPQFSGRSGSPPRAQLTKPVSNAYTFGCRKFSF